MMKKLLKIATVCSLAFSLSTATLVYATEPDPDPDPAPNYDTRTFITDSTVSEDVNATVELVNKLRYAIDVFWSPNLVFHYQIGSSFNPTNFTSEASSTTVTLSQENQATAAKVDDISADGKWFGFDGVINRIVVLNRSNSNVNMAATSAHTNSLISNHGSEVSINLFLNGDNLTDSNRKLNVTTSKAISLTEAEAEEEDKYESGQVLYDTTNKTYTTKMLDLIKYRQAFSTKDEDTDGGRFSANPEGEGTGDVTVSEPIRQVGDGSSPANNTVLLAAHSLDGSDHLLGYALVYFDLSGKPYDLDSSYPGVARYTEGSDPYTNATELGTITLTFSAAE